ncbi:MAG: DNA polymerase III subunit delta' [Salinisphaeraceae bacterium]|nr:DNA polymerase III subunit delta' [Salinisphaeraceae bacterium]
MNNEYLPWHKQQWQLVSSALRDQRLPHALLLHGPSGLGKSLFKEQLARLLLCSEPQPSTDSVALKACGECKVCRQFSEEGIHADMYRLEPEEPGKPIKIAVTREAIEFCTLASHYGGQKLVLIEPAEALNLNAANALLKTLEEPTSDTTLVLVSHQASKLLPTIRSRCLQIRFNKPERASAIQWLEAQGLSNAGALLDEVQGYPLHARAMTESDLINWRKDRDKELLLFVQENRSASGLAKLWANHDPEAIHTWLYDRLRRIVWLKSGQPTGLDDKNSDISKLASMPQFNRIEELFEQINNLKSYDIFNINNQLQIESLLISLVNDANA